MTALRWGSITDVGRVRDNNEDQFLVESPLFAVADGMGGAAAGEVAAEVAVEALRVAYSRGPKTTEALADAVEHANRAVWERASSGSGLRGMGTTITAVALVDDGDGVDRFAIANVGDSRAYLLRDGELTRLTDDHSVAEEMVRSGQLPADQASIHPQRHMLTRVLGMDADVQVDMFSLDTFRGDRVLVASDGLTNEMTDAQIAATLRRLGDPEEAARELVREAKAHGGNDNITVIVVDVVDDDDRARAAALANEPPRERPLDTTGPSVGEREERLGGGEDGDGDGRGPHGDDAAPAGVGARPRRLTGRVIAFTVALVVVVGAAVGATAIYARGSYYVGVDAGRVAIFKGRPGGVLWFEPTLVERADITEGDISLRVQRRLHDGHVVSSRDAAEQYVGRLRADVERRRATTTTAPPLNTPSTPVPPPPP